ncbi:MAG: glutamine amidotransferase, partial [Planctomycetia bacterium]
LLYWDGKASWRFPLQAVGDGVRLNGRIDTMTPGDMPNFTDTLQMSLNSLLKSTAMIKHVIVISDGDPQPPPASLLQAYLQAKITISTVSVASHGAFEKTNMQNIAKTTKGRYYEVTNSNRLPQIYIQETRVVARPLIYEQPTGWAPVVASPTEPTAGLPRELPPIRGLVLTTPKSTAEVPIISPLPADGDRNVLLAHWQYGLGKAVAFTSDGGRKWTADWKDQEIFGKFWSQLVRWSMRGGESENLSVSTLEKDGVVTVVVNAIDKTQEFLNFLRLNGKLVQPDRTTVDLSFRQTEPGKYVAQFPAEQAGSYLMRLGYRQAGGGEGFVSTGLNISYPPEYRDLESRRDL